MTQTTGKSMVRRTMKEGISPTYVGFLPTELRNMEDLTHIRNAVSTRSNKEQVHQLMRNMEKMIAAVPLARYDKADAPEKLDILNQLTDAYNFAWNEAVTQIRRVSEVHAEIFAKIKGFYMQIIDQYPSLLMKFREEVKDLRNDVADKDQCIAVISQEIAARDEKEGHLKEFNAGLQKEIDRIRDRKRYFKTEFNDKMMMCERMEGEITELHCEIAKMKENMSRQMFISKMDSDLHISRTDLLEAQRSQLRTIATSPVWEAGEIAAANDDLPSSRVTSRSVGLTFGEGYDDDGDDDGDGQIPDTNTGVGQSASLRRVVFNFMVTQYDDKDDNVAVPDDNIDAKKFYWLFPKICSVFVSGLQFEDSANPCRSFDDVLKRFLMHHYQTTFLSENAKAMMVKTASVLESMNDGIRLFNKFMYHAYDFFQFKFFHTALEYSVCYAQPPLSSLVSKETLSTEQAVIVIPKLKAREVFAAMFPFWRTPDAFDDRLDELDISLWLFLEQLMICFGNVRARFRTTIRNGLLLVEGVDANAVTAKQFLSFVAMMFPKIRPDMAKSVWNALLAQKDAAQGDDIPFGVDFKSYTIGLDYVVHFCASRDDYILDIMGITTLADFGDTFYDMNACMMDAVRFIVARLIRYIPSVSKHVLDAAGLFAKAFRSMRAALFTCNISEALGHYRLLLHDIDYVTVKNVDTLEISNASTDVEAKRLLDHLRERERIVGVVPKDDM